MRVSRPVTDPVLQRAFDSALGLLESESGRGNWAAEPLKRWAERGEWESVGRREASLGGTVVFARREADGEFWRLWRQDRPGVEACDMQVRKEALPLWGWRGQADPRRRRRAHRWVVSWRVAWRPAAGQ